MVDTEKYLKLIEERNHELERNVKGKKEAEGRKETPISGNQSRKSGLILNTFKKAGIPLEDEEPEEDAAEGKKEIPEVTVDLDAEYFKWKAKRKKITKRNRTM